MGNKLKLKPNQEFNFLGYRFDLNNGEVSPTEKKFNFLGYRFDLNKGEVSPTEKKWQILTKAIEGLQTNVCHGDSNIAREDSSNGQATYEAISMVSENPLEISPIFLHSNTMLRDLEKASELVERPKQYVGRLSHLGNLPVSGMWSDIETNLHINILELKAVFLTIKSFQTRLLNKRVLVSSDYVTVVTYLNKQGATHSLDMCLMV